MSVRVVARIRPLLKSERDVDQILTKHPAADDTSSIVKIPNPKNLAEEYSFQFNSVYGQDSTQQQIFDSEVSPTIKQLFKGLDVTIFAYGSTGTGKTHTMRGGKSLADRGMIPRLLSNIYRKSKALEKSSDGASTVQVAMSYYEIYNDRVFDLFQTPESRTATGLPIREAEGGKTVVVGLTEEPCSTLKDFEVLYDKANANRSTGATKLNAQSSRSHAILCVKLTIISPTETRVSTASAIDLAGSEDNRRTGNGKDRMVESASINKSLFVLAQCVEAISKRHSRIPHRESKMTRILSLGQNNGITVMILNLAPTKSFHLDTLSSLNFANRTKKIEVREIENEPIFKGPPRPAGPPTAGTNLQRQPLRPLTHIMNANMNAQQASGKEKPLKAFSVYSDRSKPAGTRHSNGHQKNSPLKRSAEHHISARPAKMSRPDVFGQRPRIYNGPSTSLNAASVESIVERKVSAMQKRLDELERRLKDRDDERDESLGDIQAVNPHKARTKRASADSIDEHDVSNLVKNAKLPGNARLPEEKAQLMRNQPTQPAGEARTPHIDAENDDSYIYEAGEGSDADYASEEEHSMRKKQRKPAPARRALIRIRTSSSPDPLTADPPSNSILSGEVSPRTKHVMTVINSRDVSQIKKLVGVGPKKAESILDHLRTLDGVIGLYEVRDLAGLKSLKGLGSRGLDLMRDGVTV
jgi:hypothetical protein